MNSQSRLTMDKQTFLQWAEGREGRFELKKGVIAMMAGGSRAHARITLRLATTLLSRLDLRAWDVLSGDLAVDIDGDIRFPDVLVELSNSDDKALSTATPVMVAEVLSPSSMANDLHIKAAEYMSLASLEAYIVAAQDEPRLWIWNRADAASGRVWPKVPTEVHGKDKTVPVTCFALELPMAEIYAVMKD